MTGRDVPRLADYIDHMLEAIGRISRYLDRADEQTFLADSLLQDAVIRNLEIIGEAARNVEKRFPEFASQHPQVPWAVAYEMRNVLAHGYFTVDLGVVWQTVKRDLPGLQEQVGKLRAQVG